MKGISWLDVKLGGRMLAKHPGLSLVGGLGMAVAIAISVGFFAFITANVYPVLPLDEGERIVALENRDVELDDENRQALHDFVLWREQLRTVDDLGAFRTAERNLITGEGPPEPLHVAEMTASGFRLARVPAQLGRHLTEEDERDGAPPVVVIGHRVWQNRFGGDPSVLGRTIRLGTTQHTVVGVMPEDFGFPQNHQYWLPLRTNPAVYERGKGPEIFIFGRLARGVTLQQAQAELTVIGERTAAAFPQTNAKLRPMVMPYTHSLMDIQGTTTWMVVQMQLMVSLLLLVVAMNVAVLVYARTAARRGEIAVRTALGASRGSVITQLFVEALVLSLGAAAVGLGLAQVGVRMGNQLLEMEMGTPFWADYRLRPATVLFTVALAVLSAVIVGVLPALQATGRSLQTSLRQLGGSSGLRLGRTWTMLIVAQVAIAVAGLPAAVSIAWMEIPAAATRPTYPADEFLMAEVAPELAPGQGADARADSLRFGQRVTELMRRLEAEPSVAGVTYEVYLADRKGPLEVEGLPAPSESPAGHWVSTAGVAPGYLSVYGARILAGRAFGPGDLDPRAASVIVNQAFVTQVLGGGPALGRRIRHMGPPSGPSGERKPGPWYEIVGVSQNLSVNPMDPSLVKPGLAYPVTPGHAQSVGLDVRVRGIAPQAFAPRLRELAVAVDPTLRLGQTYSLEEFEAQDRLAVRLVALVVGLVVLSVFLLSGAGIYALTSFTVTQRRREIGIRSALGAHPRQVLGSVFAGVTRQVALGLVVGVVAAFAVDRAAGGELMNGKGAVLVPVVGITMAIVSVVAAMGPARRGLRIQPMEALRDE